MAWRSMEKRNKPFRAPWRNGPPITRSIKPSWSYERVESQLQRSRTHSIGSRGAHAVNHRNYSIFNMFGALGG